MLDAEVIFKSPVFAELDNAVRAQLALYFTERTFAAGQVLLLSHEPSDLVYFVTDGVLRTYYSSLEGREYVLSYLVQGDVFNLEAILLNGVTQVTVDALSDTRLCTISGQRFMQLLKRYPSISQGALKYLAGQVQQLNDMVEGLALHTVRTRLARFLLARADRVFPHRRWTQGDIAAHIGTVRDVVGRTLREMARKGLVRRERGRLVLVNRAGLEEEAMRLELE